MDGSHDPLFALYTKGTVLFVYFLFDFSDDAFADACQPGNLTNARAKFTCAKNNVIARCLGIVLQGRQVGDTARHRQEIAHLLVTKPDRHLVVEIQNVQGLGQQFVHKPSQFRQR